MSEPNEYTALLQEQDEDKASQVRQSVFAGSTIAADRAASIQRLSKTTGIPFDAVAANESDVQRQTTVDALDYSDLVNKNPGTAEFLGDVANSRIAHDDVNNLTATESLLTSLDYLRASGKAGLFNFGSAVYKLGGMAMPGQMSDEDAAIAFGDKPKLLENQQNSWSAAFAGLSKQMAAWGDEAAQDISPNTKAVFGDMKYATTDTSKAAYLSPTKIVGDAIRSLPTTAALAVTVMLTRGAAKQAAATEFKSQIAAGATKELAEAAARDAGIKAGASIAARVGAGTEGAAGYAQQSVQTQRDIEAMSEEKLKQSPRYAELTAQGYSPEAVRLYLAATTGEESGIKAGTIDALTNLVGGRLLGKIIGEGGKVVPRMAKGAATEGVTEAVQSAGEQVAKNDAMRSNIDAGQSLTQDVDESALQGLVVGGFTGGAFSSMAGGVSRSEEKAVHADGTAQKLSHLDAAAKAGKVRARDADAYADFIGKASANGPVQDLYIDAAALNQSGVDIKTLADVSPSIAQQYMQAVATGADIRIPVAEFATAIAGTDLAQAIIPHTKADPDGWTQNEANVFRKEQGAQLESDVSDVLTKQDHDSAFDASKKVVRDNILEQLKAAGRFGNDASMYNAIQMAEFYGAQAKDLGVTPEELMRMTPVKIVADMDMSAGRLDQQQEPSPLDIFDQATTIEVQAPEMSEQEINDAETRFLSAFPSGTRYTRNTGLLKRVRRASEEAGRELDGSEGKTRHVAQKLGPFSGYQITGSIAAPDSFNPQGFLAIDVYGDEQVQLGLDAEPALTFTVSADGELIVNGPAPSGETFREFKKLGWADNGRDANGDEMQGWSALKGPDGVIPVSQIMPLLADVHARTRIWQMVDHVGLHWSRATGAIGGLEGMSADNGTAIFFQSKGLPDTIDGRPTANSNGQPIAQTEEAIRAFYKWFGDSKVVDDQGRPLVVYHGSNYTVDGFDPMMLGMSTGAQSARKGFFFAGNPKTSEAYTRLNAGKLKNPNAVFSESERKDFARLERDASDRYDNALERYNAGLADFLNEFSARYDGRRLATGGIPKSELKKAENDFADQIGLTALRDETSRLHRDWSKRQRSRVDDYLLHPYGGGNIMPVYLSIKEPQFHDFEGAHYRDQSYADIIGHANKSGGDGVILKNTYDGGPLDTIFVALYPSQIKSATGNDGTFDANDPSILSQSAQFNKSEDGARGAFFPDTNTIALLKKADLSTFLHESGHFYLQMMTNIAAMENAPERIATDVQKVMDWFGVDSVAVWNSMAMEQQREHHEKFARGFEAYVFEGKAPSIELRRIFQRFSDWLKRIYMNLSGLDVELTDEVRGVFDRMLATEEQINEAQAVNNMKALFEEKPEFMSDADWTAYQDKTQERTDAAKDELQTRSLRDMQWLDNAKSKILKDMQAQNADKRKAMRAEVAAEVTAEPVNVARAFLSRGELPDADRNNKQRRILEAASMGSTKLSLPVLKEMYGDGPAAQWRYLSVGTRGVAAVEGMHPDEAAELFGYASGDALVRAMLAEPTAKTKIEDVTDQRMIEKYGDLNSPEALSRAVDEAIYSKAHTKLVATQLAALEKAVGRNRTMIEAAKEYAEDLVSRLIVSKIRPRHYAAAEARAAKAARDAFRKGNLEESAKQTRNQLIQGYATTAAYDAQSETDKTIARFKKMTTGKADVVAKTRNMDIVNAVRAILGLYGIGSQGQRAADYIDLLQKNDPATFAVVEPSIKEAIAGANDWKTMSLQELRALRDEVESLWQLSRSSRLIEIDGKMMEITDAEDQLVARMDEIGVPDRIPGEGHAVTVGEERISMFKTIIAAARRVEFWAEKKDGLNPMGPFRRLVFTPIKEGADRYRADKAVYLKRYRDLLKPIALTLTKTKISAPELGYTFGFDKGGMGKVELLHAILHTGNNSNKRKLLLGREWASLDEDGVLDTRQWDAFVSRMIREGRLNKADFDFAQGVWDLLEDMKPLAQKTHRAVFGRYFDEVTANAFSTPFGEYRGGYVPAMTDARVVADAKTRSLAEEENSTLTLAFPSTSRGFTKGRTEYNQPLMLDLRTLSQHIDKVLLFSHLEAPIRDVRKLMTRKKVASALNRIDPAAFNSLLSPWLYRTARQQVETPVAGYETSMRFFSVVRSRAGMAAMFANASNTVQQLTGLVSARLKVNRNQLLKAAADYARSPREFTAAVAEASIYMAGRMENETSAMNREINDILLNPTTYENAKNFAAKHAYFLQSAFDNVISPIVWTGAYNQAIEAAPAGMSGEEIHRHAVRLADSAVRETQGSSLPEDVSTMETGNAFIRLFTQFAGYFNGQVNLVGNAMVIPLVEMGLRKGAGRAMYAFMFGFLVPAWVATGIAIAFRGGPEDEDKDGEYLDDWMAHVFGWGTVRTGTAMIPVAGQIVNAGVNSMNSKPYDDRIGSAPAISMIESSVRAPASVYHAIVDDQKPDKAIRDVGTLVSMWTGIPVLAPAKPIGYAADVATGDVDPSGPFDYTRGLVTGSASPESKR